MREPGAEPRPYQRVYAHLRGRIERGELAHGAQLPSQPALAAEYGVALLTVRHAIELLRRAGYVSVEHGRGTFVTDPRGADTVLVVDDDARVRSVLVEHVAYAGFRVLEASNGLEALEVLGKEPVSLVFTDLRMPTMDGIELLRRARPRFPSTIFIVVSAYPDDLVALYRSDAFPITVIPKPFRAEQVRRSLALLRGSDSIGGHPRGQPTEARADGDRAATPIRPAVRAGHGADRGRRRVPPRDARRDDDGPGPPGARGFGRVERPGGGRRGALQPRLPGSPLAGAGRYRDGPPDPGSRPEGGHDPDER